MFSREQIETLKPYEEYFESATVANYVRNIPGNKTLIIKETWEKASGEIIREKLTCGVCLLNFIKKVGQHYYKDKEKYRKEDEFQSQPLSPLEFPEDYEEIREQMNKENETKKEPGNSTKRRTSMARTSANSRNKGANKRSSKENK